MRGVGISASVAVVGAPESVADGVHAFRWPVVGLSEPAARWQAALLGSRRHPAGLGPPHRTVHQRAEPLAAILLRPHVPGRRQAACAGGHITDDHGLPDDHPVLRRLAELERLGAHAPGPLVSDRRTMLGSGAVVILAGRDESGVVVAEPEVWSSGAAYGP